MIIKKKIVYTVGTFDLLHVGHLALLEYCKSLGDIFVVGVASDSVVNSYKPNVPVVPLDQRLEMLKSLKCVDSVQPYYELEYVTACKDLDVDIFVIGEDWGDKSHNKDVESYLKAKGREIVQISYNPRTSSTRIKQVVIGQSLLKSVYDSVTLFFLEEFDNLIPSRWSKLMFFMDGAGSCEGGPFTDFEYVKYPYGPAPVDCHDSVQSMQHRGIINLRRNMDSTMCLEKSTSHALLLESANIIIDSKKGLRNILNSLVAAFGGWDTHKLTDLSKELDVYRNSEMYSLLDLRLLKEDSFLKEGFGQSSLLDILFSSCGSESPLDNSDKKAIIV